MAEVYSRTLNKGNFQNPLAENQRLFSLYLTRTRGSVSIITTHGNSSEDLYGCVPISDTNIQIHTAILHAPLNLRHYQFFLLILFHQRKKVLF